MIEPAQVVFHWPSTTGQTYTLQRRPNFDSDGGDLTLDVSGDGETMTFLDTTAPAAQAFYRLVSESSAETEALAFSEAFAGAPLLMSEERDEAPREVDGCGVITRTSAR